MRARRRARTARAGPGRLERVLQDHARALASTLDALRTQPLGTLLTAFVIGVTLALPAALACLYLNLHQASLVWGGNSLQTSLFLRDSVTPEAGRGLRERIAAHPGVMSAHYMSQEDALAEFRSASGMQEALALLPQNPLPALIVVTPDPAQGRLAAQALMKELSSLPEVEHAQADEQWMRRLYGIFEVLERAALLLGCALGGAVLIVVANTIRLDIENRRDEIVVMKEIGASNTYVRRPFLYMGAGYGVVGALIACLLVEGGALLLAGPAARLAALYQAGTRFSGLDGDVAAAVLAAGIALGWLGAFAAVTRHLRMIEPR